MARGAAGGVAVRAAVRRRGSGERAGPAVGQGGAGCPVKQKGCGGCRGRPVQGRRRGGAAGGAGWAGDAGGASGASELHGV